MNPASYLPVSVVGLLALLTFWLGGLADKTLLVDDAGFRHDPDYIVENFVATAFDQQGFPRYALAAATMTHYMDDDTTVLESPRFRQHLPGAPLVKAQSVRGLISSNGDHMHLLKDVRLTRAAVAGTPETVMQTEYLHITPEAEQMRTDKSVLIRQGGSTLRADRWFSDGRKRSLELEGQVKGIYEAQRR